jgi:FkbM family methyltransferase
MEIMTSAKPAGVNLLFLQRAVRLLPRGRNVVLHHLYKHIPLKDRKLFKTSEGFSIVAGLADQVGKDLFFHGVYEPITTAVIKHLLRPGDIFMDVGANIGFFALLAARLVGRTGKVYAFEPNEETRLMMIESLRANEIEHVVVDPRACTEKSGRFILVPGGLTNLGGTKVEKASVENGEGSVEGVRLDDFFAEEGLENVRLLKMDIEGGEDAALAGMERALERRLVDYLLVEFHPVYDKARGAERVDELLRKITGNGYSTRQLHEIPRGFFSRYRCNYSERLFFAPGETSTSMREIGTPQYLFERIS